MDHINKLEKAIVSERWLCARSVDELPGDGNAADRLGSELREGSRGEVEVVFRAGVAFVLDGGGDAPSVVYERFSWDESLYERVSWVL